MIVIGFGSFEVHCSKSIEKKEVIQEKLHKIYNIFHQYFPVIHYLVYN